MRAAEKNKEARGAHRRRCRADSVAQTKSGGPCPCDMLGGISVLECFEYRKVKSKKEQVQNIRLLTLMHENRQPRRIYYRVENKK